MIDDEEIQSLALQILAEIPTVGYAQILEYLQRIGEFTVSLLVTNRYRAIKYSMLFWNNLCKEEVKLNQQSMQIINQCFSSLMPIILSGLSITEYEDDDTEIGETIDDDKWTVALAAQSLLQDVTTIVKD